MNVEILQFNEHITKLKLSVQQLRGVGPETAEALKRLGCNRILDLIWHLPSTITPKKVFPPIFRLTKGEQVVLKITITDIEIKPKNIVHIYGQNETGMVTINYYNFYPKYILDKLKIGDSCIIGGKVDIFHGTVHIAHPDYYQEDNIPQWDIIYPLTYGLNSRQLSKLIQQALHLLPEFPEWLPNEMIVKNNWPSFKKAIELCHSVEAHTSNRHIERLAFDELLANQLMIILRRYQNTNLNGIPIAHNHQFRQKLLLHLPFSLTEAQYKVIEELDEDLTSGRRMIRLLQGDVGSGKTVVALIAALAVIEEGYQVCFMVPTDLLANQHYEWIMSLSNIIEINVGLLTGKVIGKKRQTILKDLATNAINFIIGTHALFQDNVIFQKLGLVIIDEQHRFGVEQRAALANKGIKPHILYMTATPIPRTLCLMLYGDIDSSKLIAKPMNRLPIKTSVISKDKINELMLSLRNILAKGEKVYWVCPFIEDKEEADLAATEARFNELQVLYQEKVGLLHGKLPKKQKEEVMNQFVSGSIDIIVTTTVIEVGINVPMATLMVIEEAEKFGLAQLHQLRGRVGRSYRQSHCILLYGKYISNIARQRLNIMRTTEDGFKIAEEDLKLRGPGDIIGRQQSGAVEFKFANLIRDQYNLAYAHKLASEIIKADNNFTSSSNLRYLLDLFSSLDSIQLGS